MFADEINLFYTNKNIKVLFKTVNKELHYVNEWFIANKQSISQNTKIFVHKQSARDSIPLRLSIITFNSIEIKRESFVKFLGITIDENFS